MPQINKVRVVNFYYNEGNRFIPDELYDLTNDRSEALNSVFNLDNGGGKTVLVQLMMQPVHPRAMAGGRRIEDYFTRQGDHSFVLIEWSTDGSREKLMTGIAMAARISSSSDETLRGSAIKYYTFKSVYENYSPYSIEALELSANEKGRYVPAAFDYVRERAKASRGMLEYYSSDEGVRWAQALSEYGILRSEWENVIETLNRDEGGLNQYFEEAKTSDKLIGKFFIPAIEQKIKNAGNGKSDGSLETMLISYGRKISEKESVIAERDVNRRLLSELGEMTGLSGSLSGYQSDLAKAAGDIRGFNRAVSLEVTARETKIESIEKDITLQEDTISHIIHEEKSGEYHQAVKEHEDSQRAYESARQKYSGLQSEIEDLRHRENLLQCARLKREISEGEGNIAELKRLIEDEEKTSGNAVRIASLKYSVKLKAGEEAGLLEAEIRREEESLSRAQEALERARQDQKEAENRLAAAQNSYNKAEAALDEAKYSTDNLAAKLDLDAVRQLDGFYNAAAVDEEKAAAEKRLSLLENDRKKLCDTLKKLEDRKDEIPAQRANVSKEIADRIREKEGVIAQIAAFDALYDSLAKICEKYSIDATAVYTGRLREAIQENLDSAGAGLHKFNRDKEDLTQRLDAAREGYVHILPRIMDYVRSTGISCQTGEEYICNLAESGSITPEDTSRILDSYPEVAYSLLFSDEKAIKKFRQAGGVDYLPAPVPLLTMEAMASILKGELKGADFLAACDREYFADREGYREKREAEIRELEQRIERSRALIFECAEEKKLADEFDYPASWRTDSEAAALELTSAIGELESQERQLDAELSRLRTEMSETSQKIDDIGGSIHIAEKRSELFADLMDALKKEEEYYSEKQEKYTLMQAAQSHRDKAGESLLESQGCLDGLRETMAATRQKLKHRRDILKEVDNAVETGTQEGELDVLYSRYATLRDNMSEDLERLNQRLKKAVEDNSLRERELAGFGDCEPGEYETLVYSPESVETIRRSIFELEKDHKAVEAEYHSCGNINSACETREKIAISALEVYGGVVLSENEIGTDFEKRKSDARKKEKALNLQKKEIEGVKKSLERVKDRNAALMDAVGYEGEANEIQLSQNPGDQWEEMRKKYSDGQKIFNSTKNRLCSRIRDVENEFRDKAMPEILGKLCSIRQMLESEDGRGERLFNVSEGLLAMVANIEKINSRIETDLREIEHDFDDIVNQCMNQGRRMYRDLRAITASSKAHIFPEKPQTQMVRMNLPEEKEISEEASRISIETEIRNGANEIMELIRSGAEDRELQKRAGKIVSSQRLLHRYIKQDSIQVKVFKIDLNAENSGYKRWEDTLTQSSGAEKFVVFFSVVLTLINYTRSSSGMIGRNSKSVLLLDNPFGKITSAHLLKPMFDIAKHFNVQLICLSDINKSDVINCFDCVIKLVIKNQSLSNFEIMTHEGNERIEHGYYKVMNGQISLF